MFRSAAIAVPFVLACATSGFAASITADGGMSVDLLASPADDIFAPTDQGMGQADEPLFPGPGAQADFTGPDTTLDDPMRAIRPESQWARPPEPRGAGNIY